MQMSQSVQPRVFLSYAHEDGRIAQQLATELRSRGAEVWLDIEKLVPGESLLDQISTAIRDSDIFLIIVSPASGSSPWIKRELDAALATENRTRVVPVLLGGAEMPSDLRDVIYLAAEPENLGSAAEQILRASKPVETEIDAAGKVEQVLSTIGVPWRQEPAIAGVRPDFLVESEDGKRFVIEVKGRPNPSLLEAVDARSQAVRIRDLTAADDAIVVFPTLETGLPTAGVVGLSDLRAHLDSLLASPSKGSIFLAARRPEPTQQDRHRTVFASMPFKPQYDDVYWFAMTATAEAIGATCVRVDREDFDGDIAAKIQEDIRSSVAVIADLSESNPDVLYEVGYTRRHGCPCVQICSTDLSDLPFNVRNINTILYKPGQIHELRSPLIKRLKAVLAGGPHGAT